MNIFLAHAGEDHGDVLETTQHTFEINPLLATVVTLAIVALLPWLLYKFTKSMAAATNLLLFELLAVGLLTYATLPLLSGTAIVVGFFLALFVGLGGSHKAH